MTLKTIIKPQNVSFNSKTSKQIDKFKSLVNALSEKQLSADALQYFNTEIDNFNAALQQSTINFKALKLSYKNVLKYARKELKLVPKDHYRNLWLAVGMSSFGVPIGVMFGFAFDNMAYLGIGLPIGMVIGMALGANLDKKANQEGKQLDIDL